MYPHMAEGSEDKSFNLCELTSCSIFTKWKDDEDLQASCIRPSMDPWLTHLLNILPPNTITLHYNAWMQEGTRIQTIQFCPWTHDSHINCIHPIAIIPTSINLENMCPQRQIIQMWVKTKVWAIMGQTYSSCNPVNANRLSTSKCRINIYTLKNETQPKRKGMKRLPSKSKAHRGKQ